jgi:hypothetical protein
MTNSSSMPLLMTNSLEKLSDGRKFCISENSVEAIKNKLIALRNRDRQNLEPVIRYYLDVRIQLSGCKNSVWFVFGSTYKSTEEYKLIVDFEEKVTEFFSQNIRKMAN